MATTNQTYSLIPTSTFASGYSTATNDPDNGGGPDSIIDLFSSGSSPPLIVAFLAIGLFILAMLSVFAWRRMTQSRRPYLQPVTTTDAQSKSAPLGKRPILWEAWADLDVREKPSLEATRWESMMPVAAIMKISTTTRPVEPTVARHLPIESVGLGCRVLFWALRCLVTAVGRLHSSALPPPLLPSPPPRECEEVGSPASQTSNEMEWGDVSSLQVSVLIAMPRQRRCSSGISWEEVGVEGMALGEFCIGTMDVPWSECG